MTGGSVSSLGLFSRLLGGRKNAPIPREPGCPIREHLLDLAQDYEKSGHGWFWSTGPDGRLTYVSECVSQVLGVSTAQLVGQPIQSLFMLERDEDDGTERTLPMILGTRKSFADLPVRAASQAAERWWSIAGRPQFDGADQFLGYFGNAIDVTAMRRSHRDASRLAQFDSLTGLANRHRIGKRLNAVLAAYRNAGRACAIFMLDLDRFKQVNDTLGHQAGDELLRQVAQRLQHVLGHKRFEIGRLGGDEFQVILPDVDDRGRLGELATTVIAMLSQAYQIDGSRCMIGASVGIAIAPFDGTTSEDLVRSADLALYAAKGGGRGQFRFYSSDLHSEAERRRQIEEDLRDALTGEQMRVVYQPIVDATENKVVVLEALARWEHPDLGEIAPDIFIPIAEDANLISQLGGWILHQACNEAAGWPGNVRVSVNVSAVQFANQGFLAVVAQALAQSGLAPERLELELTESVLLGDKPAAEEMFTALKMLGVRLALDDFGTGYSSLSYLQHARFDKIKIDKSFIAEITQPDSRNAAIIASIVSLAKALKMDTTAEGIEAHDELEATRKLGVNQVQGFIYAAPLTGPDVLHHLESGDWVIEPDVSNAYRPDRRTVLRRVGLIHEDHRYEAMMRHLSRGDCTVEGLEEVPVGTRFVVDFGDGQLAVAVVRRSAGAMQGLEFEQPLVDDGAGGLCTRQRVSPHVLAQAGMPLQALPKGDYPAAQIQPVVLPLTMPRFRTIETRPRPRLVA